MKRVKACAPALLPGERGAPESGGRWPLHFPLLVREQLSASGRAGVNSSGCGSRVLSVGSIRGPPWDGGEAVGGSQSLILLG